MTRAKVGDRVRLIRTTDEYTRLAPGIEGTVTFIDSLGTVHVHWDDGSRLGLVAEAGDAFERVESPAERQAARERAENVLRLISEDLHGDANGGC